MRPSVPQSLRRRAVRWYWPAELGGQCVTSMDSLVIPPLHYSDRPGQPRRLEAGFNRYGVVFTGESLPDGTSADPVNRFSDRLEVVSDTIDVLGRGVMGLTLNCARCHSV